MPLQILVVVAVVLVVDQVAILMVNLIFQERRNFMLVVAVEENGS